MPDEEVVKLLRCNWSERFSVRYLFPFTKEDIEEARRDGVNVDDDDDLAHWMWNNYRYRNDYREEEPLMVGDDLVDLEVVDA